MGAVEEQRNLPAADTTGRILLRREEPWPAVPRPVRTTSLCLYCPSVDPSGIAVHMLDLAAQFLPDRHVAVMCWDTDPGRRVLDRAAELGARALALPHPRAPSFAQVIVRSLEEYPVEVFHVHVGTGREDFDGARAARRAGVPAVVQTQHLPWLLTDRRKRRPFFRALQEVDQVICVSQGQRRTYEEIGVLPEHLTTVPNGVLGRAGSPGRRGARRALDLGDQQPVVMTVGRLEPPKGQRHLIDSVPGLVSRFPDLAVLVLGRGHLHAQLAAHARALGVGSAVRLLGHRTDARMLLDAADVFVLPSLYEGMPLAVLEAMEAGLPVVATDVTGSAEVVVDGQTGYLVPARDPRALGQALAGLLGDAGRRARYGTAGQLRYRQHFTSQRMAQSTSDVHDQVLQRAR